MNYSNMLLDKVTLLWQKRFKWTFHCLNAILFVPLMNHLIWFIRSLLNLLSVIVQ